MRKLFTQIFSMASAGFLLLLLAFSLGLATFVENAYGVETAHTMVYNAWWLELILLLLTINLIGNFFIFKLYRPEKLTLGVFHLAFVVIVLGAGITRYFGKEGVVHLREGESTDRMSSTETVFQIEASSGMQRGQFSTPLALSSSNRFDHQLNLGGKNLRIASVQFVPQAIRSVDDSKGDQPLLELVYTQGGSMANVILHPGEVVRPNGEAIGFEADGKTRFVIRHDSLFVTSSDTLKALDMGGNESSSYPPGSVVACAEKVIYRCSNTALVVKKFHPKARIIALPGEGKTTGENALLVEISSGEKKELITLWSSARQGAEKISGQIDGIDFSMWVGPKETSFPFTLHLNKFILQRYPGSNSPSSYESQITLTDAQMNVSKECRIFMNNVLNHRGYRFYQSSYDMDEKGTILSVNQDVAGTTVTYIGYALLFLGIIVSIFNPKSRFYGLMKRASKGVTYLLILIGLSSVAKAQSVQPVDKSVANAFARLWVQGHDGRLKPVSTLAYEVVMKSSRSESVIGQSPEQVILGMLVNPQAWQSVEMIAVNDSKIEAKIGISGSKARFVDFFDGQGQYKLAQDIEKAYEKKPAERGTFDNALIKVDERINVLYMMFRGESLQLFPSKSESDLHWYSPAAQLPASFGRDTAFVSAFFPKLIMAIKNGNSNEAITTITEADQYQKLHGKGLIPGDTKKNLEIAYNRINIFRDLSMVYLLLGLGLLGLFFRSLFSGKKLPKKVVSGLTVGLFAGFLAHCAGLIVRGYVSGHMPWSNGYESMIYIAWAGMLAGLLFAWRNPMVLAAASILSGLTLFVAQMSWLNPEITNLVPVLKSYWLTIHVAIITASYGFLGVSALLGLINLILIAFRKEVNRNRIEASVLQLTVIAEAATILGLYFLTIGTFLGGIWANESWGRYWGWDPKETWSLVTIILYSFIAHMRLIPGFKGWFAFNLASVLGLLSVLMTYLGVNYYLAGLHSYGSGEGLQFPLVVVVLFGAIAIIAWKANRNDDLKADGGLSEQS